LVQDATEGEEIIIAKSGKPLLRLVLYESKKKKTKREFGFLKDKIIFSKDFDSPLPPEILKYFEGNS
jgi:antitoxin (DNA-binding transcriptional repressor) of toxin-antitoxin stability system